MSHDHRSKLSWQVTYKHHFDQEYSVTIYGNFKKEWSSYLPSFDNFVNKCFVL